MANSIRFHFFDRMELWYNRSETPELAREGHSNLITLSEAFYREIDQHKIFVERKVVAALANAPGTLDLYVWLVWRSWSLRGTQFAYVPLFGKAGLANQLGSTEYVRDRRFRGKIGSVAQRNQSMVARMPRGRVIQRSISRHCRSEKHTGDKSCKIGKLNHQPPPLIFSPCLI